VSVNPDALDNPERSLALENRETRTTRRRLAPIPSAVAAVIASAPTAAEAELAEIKGRLAAARKLRPAPEVLHCRDCFGRGRDAVLDFIEGR
jgi:hypothetical protein